MAMPSHRFPFSGLLFEKTDGFKKGLLVKGPPPVPLLYLKIGRKAFPEELGGKSPGVRPVEDAPVQILEQKIRFRSVI